MCKVKLVFFEQPFAVTVPVAKQGIGIIYPECFSRCRTCRENRERQSFWMEYSGSWIFSNYRQMMPVKRSCFHELRG
ncbi:MAG: hypothetical protein DRH32_07245, partial [Deltaproteobacteria bacterium]